jgi:hypothetical protein
MMMVTVVVRQSHNKSNNRTVGISPSIDFHMLAAAETSISRARGLATY